MKAKNDITAAEVKSLLDYDKSTGLLTWRRHVAEGRKSRGGNSRPGREAGTVNHNYKTIQINGRTYYAHRLIYLWMTGEWPPLHMDHKNGDGHDNRWENLRPATHTENALNQGLSAKNTSGYKGVSKIRKNGRWRAQIVFNKIHYEIGSFDTPREAHAAYCAAAKLLHGKFARFE